MGGAMIDREKIQNNLDKLLIFMNDTVEQFGRTIKAVRFDFNQNSQASLEVMGQNNWSYDELVQIVNIAITRNLITHAALGSHLVPLALTGEGQGRAISSAHGLKRSYELKPDMSIGIVNAQGSVQIGYDNTQSLVSVIADIDSKIEQSEASPEDKADAKELWQQVLKNPLLQTILSKTDF